MNPRESYLPMLGRTMPGDKSTTKLDQHQAQRKMTRTIVDKECMMKQIKKVEFLFPNLELSSSINQEVTIDYIGCGSRTKMPTDLYYITVATKTEILVFDCVNLDPRTICCAIQPLLCNRKVLKIVHDVHILAAIFQYYLRQDSKIEDSNNDTIVNINSIYDTQLYMEMETSQWDSTLKEMIIYCKVPNTYNIKRALLTSRYAHRPLPQQCYDYMMDDAKHILQAFEHQCEGINLEEFTELSNASKGRYIYAASNHGERNLCFDIDSDYKISSHELMKVMYANESRICSPAPIIVSNDATPLIDLLPKDLAGWFYTTNIASKDEMKSLTVAEDEKKLIDDTERIQKLFEIVLDKGRPPYAWIGSTQRAIIGSNTRLVQEEDIEHIITQLGKFGSDNRAGLERQLHRISAMRNRNNDVIGLTMRVGRHVSGNAYIISDLLHRYPTESILFLGEPGSGKTTVVREATRLLAERYNVCIVDTSNEIAGDGDIPHPCVGHARRMMVPSLDQQSQVMIECVQNHTPEIIVIDEIGRSNEVEAARTCKNRGVRLIASAHGDLRKLLKNPKLRGLIGGIEKVTIGDEEARKIAKERGQSQIQKNKSERGGEPTFEIIVELKRGVHNEWTIIFDSGSAVDKILEGKEYNVQRRTRNPKSGAIHIVTDTA